MTESAMLATHTSVREHARRLWRDAAEGPDGRNYLDPRKDLDAFIATFDEAEFTPAMPERRERWTTAEFERDVAALGMGGEGGDREGESEGAAAAAMAGPTDALSATMDFIDGVTASTSPSSRSKLAAASVDLRRPVHSWKDAASAPRQTTSPVPIMGLTLGGYFRWLRDISERFVRSGGAAALARRRRAHHGGRAPSVEELLDNPSSIDELMEAAMHRRSMLGTSVGSTAARVVEAVRRKLVGRDRVALAFELADDGSGEPSDAAS